MNDASNPPGWGERTTLLAGPVVLPAGEDTAHYLLMLEGGEPGRLIELGAEPLTLGRALPAALVLPDPQVSRSHCSIGHVAGRLVVTDLGSTNGTFVQGQRVDRMAFLPVGGLLQVGRHVFRYECRNRKEVEAADALDRDLARAERYLRSLLPEPIAAGPVRTDWVYLPSARLGGDAFGYMPLGPETFAVYLLDVSGHGVESALHAASAANALRRRALPQADFLRPSSVVAQLNQTFPMEERDGLYFTCWYGVYDGSRRRLLYCSAGHHPAYLRDDAARGMRLTPLQTRAPAVGLMPESEYVDAEIEVPSGVRLYLFSDGAFEIVTSAGRRWSLEDFLPLLALPPEDGQAESQRLLEAVRREVPAGPFEDDVSILTVAFA